MRLRNPFSDATRELFWEVRYRCFGCGGNGQDCGGMELHHIFGRVSASPYNAAPLCKRCHGKVGHTDPEQQTLLQATKRYLKQIWYAATTDDKAFLEKYDHTHQRS